MTWFTFRFLWVVIPHFRQSALVMAACATFGVWTVRVMPGDVGAPYVVLLFCQLFTASSEFRLPADSGHLDPLLVKGALRHRLALSHWALSGGPGWMAWFVVAVAEAWSIGVGEAVGWRLTSFSSILIVSSLAWAATLPATRFLGGAIWVLTMGLLALSADGLLWVQRVLEGPQATTLEGTLSGVVLAIAIPFVLLVPAARTTVGQPAVLASIIGLSGLAVAMGVHWITARDFTERA
jgi:hypothetical protein